MVNIYCEGGVVLGTIAWYALGKLGVAVASPMFSKRQLATARLAPIFSSLFRSLFSPFWSFTAMGRARNVTVAAKVTARPSHGIADYSLVRLGRLLLPSFL